MSFESSLISPTNLVELDKRTRGYKLSFKIITESGDLSEQRFLQRSHQPQDFHLFPSVELSSCQFVTK